MTASAATTDGPGAALSERPAARRGFRGPFARWPRTADTVLAVLVLLMNLFLDDRADEDFALRGLDDVQVLAVIAIVVGSLALVRRRHDPLTVLGVVLGASVLSLVGGEGVLGALPLALYAAGRFAPEVRWSGLGVVAGMVLMALTGAEQDWPLGEVLFGLFVLDLAWYLGRRVRQRGERAAQLLREREAEAHQALADERARIARELHDVVAHRVSLMTVQAGAAKTVVADDPEGAFRAMEAVEQAGRQALGELRHLLGVLRPEAGGDLAPQPSLADLPRLVARFEQAGLPVACSVHGAAVDLPVPVQVSAHRIVQEALTNVLRHAGPDVRAAVEVRVGDDAVELEVVDDGKGGSRPSGMGHGIVGMRERAQLLGGTLDAGPRQGGGFHVTARLPLGRGPA